MLLFAKVALAVAVVAERCSAYRVGRGARPRALATRLHSTEALRVATRPDKSPHLLEEEERGLALSPPLSRAEGARPRLDPHSLAANAVYEKNPWAQVGGVAYFGAMCAGIGSRAVPPFARLVLLQYLAFSGFEYVFHRWMDRVFAKWNRLHVQHHVDTNADMTMVEGYNWKGIRFNYLTSKLAIVIGTGLSLAVCTLGRLDLPLWPTPAAAALVSLYHGVLWNRLHTDSHGLQTTLTWDDGIPYVAQVPTANRYARWLLTNHIGHHAVGGKGNYNIVFPGPDHLAGTFYRLKQGDDRGKKPRDATNNNNNNNNNNTNNEAADRRLELANA